MDNKPVNKQTNIQIQILRGFLCLMIVFFHYTCRYGQLFELTTVFSNSKLVSAFGLFGVMCFFIISGLYTKAPENMNSKQKILYWIRKYLLIYSVYLVAILLIYTLSFLKLYGDERIASFPDFIQNIFLVNNITGATSVDGAHWYVFFLFVIYFWIAVLHMFSKDKNKLFIGLLVVVNLLVFLMCGVYKGEFLWIVKIMKKLLGSNYLGMFMLGYVVRNKPWNKNKLYSIFILGCVCLQLVVVDLRYMVMLPIGLVLVCGCYYEKIVVIERIKVLRIIGDASFSIYLIHQNIGYMCINILIKYCGYYVSVAITFVCIILLGIGMYRYVEIPIKKLVKRYV